MTEVGEVESREERKDEPGEEQRRKQGRRMRYGQTVMPLLGEGDVTDGRQMVWRTDEMRQEVRKIREGEDGLTGGDVTGETGRKEDTIREDEDARAYTWLCNW